DGCGFGNAVDGNAIINAVGNLKGVFGFQGFGLDAVAGGNGNATVNYHGGTIDVSGPLAVGIFATGVSGATITTDPGTTIIVGQQSPTDRPQPGIDAFSDEGPATATVASTIQITGSVAAPTTNYKSNPTGIRATSDVSGDASVTYTGPGITVRGGGAL